MSLINTIALFCEFLKTKLIINISFQISPNLKLKTLEVFKSCKNLERLCTTYELLMVYKHLNMFNNYNKTCNEYTYKLKIKQIY